MYTRIRFCAVINFTVFHTMLGLGLAISDLGLLIIGLGLAIIGLGLEPAGLVNITVYNIYTLYIQGGTKKTATQQKLNIFTTE